MTTKPKHLYLHVPFCRTICSYCDFCHVGYQETLANQWLDAIKADIQNCHINENLRTIYIGGGTPTALSSSQLDQLLSLLDPYTRMVQEYTIEINPETFDEDKAKILQKHGVNRASIGFQTSDEKLLQMMNRHHRLEDVAETMRLLRKYGIDNISLDLMYSLPTQTMESLEKSVQDAIALEPTHLSLYSLTIEPNTVFAKKGYEHLEDDIEADMYEWICKILPQYGYQQYEISNFAKAGMISQHNCAYWNYQDFYGIGCGASGLEGSTRYDIPKNVRKYIEDPSIKDTIELTTQEQMFEAVMMGLRLKEGMYIQLFEERFHTSVLEVYSIQIKKLCNEGKLILEGNRLRCSEEGFEILNSILLEFM